MNIANKLYEILWKDIKNKHNELCRILDNLNELSQNSVKVDIAKGMILNTNFNPEDEKEREMVINYIVEFMNRLRMEFNNFITNTYTQIEALLKLRIDGINKEYEYKKYANIKELKLESTFSKRLKFIVKENSVSLSKSDEQLVDIIDVEFRKKRNNVVHELYNIYTFEQAEKLIGDGINVGDKLYSCYNYAVQQVNNILIITEDFVKLYNTL